MNTLTVTTEHGVLTGVMEVNKVTTPVKITSFEEWIRVGTAMAQLGSFHIIFLKKVVVHYDASSGSMDISSEDRAEFDLLNKVIETLPRGDQ